MDSEKVLEVIDGYRAYFLENGIGVEDFPHDAKFTTEREVLEHCHGMLHKMESFIVLGRMDKTFRWLGFIQGCLASLGIYSLDDLKNHNKPREN